MQKPWIEKQIKQAKKFLKRHKKAILIGASVVVGVAIAVCAVAAASAAATVGAAAAAVSDDEEKTSEKAKDGVVPLDAITTDEAPTLFAVVEDYITEFKELANESHFLEDGNGGPLSLSERARHFGAALAHDVLDEIADLACAIPQLTQELNDIGNRILPEFLYSPQINARENFDKMVATGHKRIDRVFSIHHERSGRRGAVFQEHFAIATLPPPTILTEFFGNINKLLEEGKILDRGGFTKAGRASMKHGYREGSIFSKPIGNPEQINEHGQRVLEKILNHPEKKIVPGELERFGKVVDVYAPDIGGVRYTVDGKFIGFLEP